MPDVARRVAGRYEIIRELGRGPAATVHLARQSGIGRLVALKELHDPAGVCPPASALSHPNIVPVFDCFDHDGTSYVVTEHAERGSLRPYAGRLTLAQLGGVLEGALAGLHHAQSHGIAHGRLKLENLLLTACGSIKLADFGGAADGPSDLAAVGRIASELCGDAAPIEGCTTWEAIEDTLIRLVGPCWRRAAAIPAEVPREAGRRRRWALSAGIAAVAGVSATAVATDGRGAVGAPATLSARGIALEVPAGWRNAPGGEVPGVDGRVALGPDAQSIVFGAGDRKWSNHRLLPRRLDPGRAAVTVTTRHGVRMLRHDGVRVDGRLASVYSAPTTRGVATVTCFAPARTCATIAASLRITKGRALPLGPDAAFIARVGSILRWLETRERPIAARLDRAATRPERVAATKQLWWTYAGAAKRLRTLRVRPADRELRRQLTEALRLAGCAYGRAAGRADRAGYEREAHLALVHEAGVRRALAGLREAGYELPPVAASAARFTRLP